MDDPDSLRIQYEIAVLQHKQCNIVFISDKINTRVVSNIIEQEVSTPETVKDTFG